MRSRGFKDETIRAYNLGAGVEEFYDENGSAHKVKLVYFPLYRKKSEKDAREDILRELQPQKPKNSVSNNSWT